MLFSLWLESTFDELYQSAVDAFPNTKARQHLVHEVDVGQFKWTPFPGVKTFLVRGLAKNEDRQYNTMILFKNVVYKDGPGRGVLKLKISTNESRYIEKLTPDEHNILVRCNCPDFIYRGAWYDHLDRSLFGRVPKKYEGTGTGSPANPQRKPMICKHLMKMLTTLQVSGLVT